LNDLPHPIVAGLISVIVNYGGTFILVFQAAKIAGLSPELTASWVWSVSIGVGLTGLFLSLRYREPIITAWSTPAAAFLVTALATTPYAEAVGAYMISAAAFVALGMSGYFEKVIRLIPPGIASGLLAGILLQFGIGAFGGASVDPLLVGLLIVAYVALKRFSARYAVVGILVLGLAFLLTQGRVDLSDLKLEFAAPVFTMPEFSLNALLSVALPLFLITLTGQYMPGMLVLRNDGFKTSANPIVTVTGLGSLIMAPFGSHAFNIAAITAAICTGKESHEDPSKRWVAGIAAGVFYIVVGIFGVTLAARLADEGWGADLMAANNVLAHVPDINDFVAGFAESLVVAQHLTRCRDGFFAGHADHGTLAACQSRRLDHHRNGAIGEMRQERFEFREQVVTCRGNLVANHDFLGKCLGRFQTSCGLAGS